ncbi:hypothetical protein [Photobacterium damselae]|uniref:hypothetical protein n=1 Tax=Photobacterium damselae TaxID=38293 RepID=UPI001F372A32|nr:hypothetical protein [Photobacterium damselae]UKA05040.1 hypothetical protein IHC89_22600 [Photobacterium damselae subsp. damselae]
MLFTNLNPKPINRSASIVIKPASLDDSFFSKKSQNPNAAKLFWVAPKPIIPISHNEIDLTGKQFGRFKVVGKIGKGRWQVRCSCGNFAARKSKAINNPKNDLDRCEQCLEILYIKREYHYKKTGIDIDIHKFDN